MSDEPPAAVRAAFGVDSGPARRLPGGSGTSWQVRGLVLKPGQHPVVASSLAGLLSDLSGPGFRIPRPMRTRDGAWVIDGWTASAAVAGSPDPVRRWASLVAASRSLHAAVAAEPKPPWLGRGRDRWTVADRAVWDGETVPIAPELADLVAALRAATRQIDRVNQLIHADLAGNVLFADGETPAVIDFSPAWRPADYAVAVAAVDVLAWSGAPASVLDGLDDQLLLRALAWRLITESLGRSDPDGRQAVRRAGEPVADLLLARVHGVAPVQLDERRVAALIGHPVGELRPVAGGHSRAVTRAGDTVFVKSGRDLDVELSVYEGLGEQPFLPRRLAGTRSPVATLVLEALAPDGWAGGWTAALVEETRALMDAVHRVPPPEGVPALRPADPWAAVAADPARLLRLHVCSPRWLTAHLDTLGAASESARVEGGSLLHRDVCAANLWQHDGRLLLADWASAAIGDPWLDHHLWLVALHAEGGPPPDTMQGPYAAGHAALIAGQQPSLTPSYGADPALFEQRRRRLEVALAWAARLLDLPPPDRSSAEPARAPAR